MKMRLLALVLSFTLAACAGAAREPRSDDHHAGGGAVRFLALGDSYTIGEGVEPAERWPVQLAAMLRARGVDLGDPEIVATTGWTTDELAAGIDAAAPAGPYALVSLLIGVNNQYRGLSVDAYQPELRALLRCAIAFAGGDAGRVIVVSIPDWSVTEFAAGRDRAQIVREVDAYNAAKREIAREMGARWVDITPTSRQMPEAVVGDGLHPSGAQYREWAELVLPEALAALGR